MNEGPIPAGTRFGVYRIDGIIGEGGMGVVYWAFDTKLNRPAAIKVLSDEIADAAARRRFQREAQTVSSLNHPTHPDGLRRGRIRRTSVPRHRIRRWRNAQRLAE
jgi:serine/threonine-protein kinase